MALEETDDMNRNELLAFDPEYWERLAEQKRNLATALGCQPTFAKVLLKHARDFDCLAQESFKLRQQRRNFLGLEARNRSTSGFGEVVTMPQNVKGAMG